uniref:Variant surface glycoprotein 696 n=1 Tax=Trypanosoma brucei TaxID=5691 RepID=M4SU70_9TRYP|nr:variant surface glycoprotein 696 [Trypanosoma brucei]
MTTNLLLGLLLITTTATQNAVTAPGDGKNTFEYRVLCALVNIAKLPTNAITLPTVSEETFLAIEVLNMSASNDEWKKNFPEEGKPDPEPTPPCTSCDKRIRCDNKYSRYKQVKSTLDTETKAQETKGKHNLFSGVQQTAAGQRWQLQLHDIATTAATLKQNFIKSPYYPAANIADEIKHDLQQALYGTQSKPAGGTYTDQWTQTGTRSADCKADKAAKSIRGDLACLCIADGTQTKQACKDTLGPTRSTWATNAEPININTIETGCKGQTKPKLTAAVIRKALSAFAHALRSNDAGGADAILLGHAHSDGSCGGTAGNACVDYTATLAPSTADDDNNIPWYKHMAAAAKKLEQVEKAKSEAEKLNSRLNELKSQAESLYKTLKISEDKQVAQTHSPGATLPVKQESKCKPQNKTPTDCPSEHCDYDEKATDGKKCKPKPGTETAAAGTGGEQAGGATNTKGKKCSSKKSADECTVNCKWEGKECKDFIFLVNNKLDLVTAAFMSMVVSNEFCSIL